MVELAREAAVRQEYLAFARGQAAGVSPSYEALALAVADDASVIALLAELPRGKQQPNLLFGVSRHLGGPVSSPVAFLTWVVERWDDVRPELLVRTTQTNEAGRCATLLPVLAGMPGPLALLEVGASAGLCLYPDRYRYDYGRGVVGAGDGPVLDCAWRRPERAADLTARRLSGEPASTSTRSTSPTRTTSTGSSASSGRNRTRGGTDCAEPPPSRGPSRHCSSRATSSRTCRVSQPWPRPTRPWWCSTRRCSATSSRKGGGASRRGAGAARPLDRERAPQPAGGSRGGSPHPATCGRARALPHRAGRHTRRLVRTTRSVLRLTPAATDRLRPPWLT